MVCNILLSTEYNCWYTVTTSCIAQYKLRGSSKRSVRSAKLVNAKLIMFVVFLAQCVHIFVM